MKIKKAQRINIGIILTESQHRVLKTLVKTFMKNIKNKDNHIYNKVKEMYKALG